MKFFFLCVCVISSFYCFGQKYATFRADTTRFEHFKDIPPYVSSQYWYVNGQKMYYGCDPIRVKVNPHKFDTIIYKGFRKSNFDTIICNVSEASEYVFYYNECCGAFNVHKESVGFLRGEVVFLVSVSDASKSFLGTLGEAAKLIKHPSDTLMPFCRSAMSPNVYPITFGEVVSCSDSTCISGYCVINDQGEDIWDYRYQYISKKLDFLFLPLKKGPLVIRYDPRRDVIELK